MEKWFYGALTIVAMLMGGSLALALDHPYWAGGIYATIILLVMWAFLALYGQGPFARKKNGTS